MSTTWFVDVLNGNDSNTGTSFAQRFLTINKAVTSAAAGDLVHVMQSPNPVDMGQTATWTNLSATVTLTSAVTQVISSCDSAWSASTNITCSTNSTRKEGTNCATFSSNASFTTGKIAFFATGTLNLSSYNQISFWFDYTGSGQLAANTLQFQLCSDTSGNTPVNSITLNRAVNANQWTPITLDTGSALGSSIQSINVIALSAFTSKSFRLDNVFAALPSTSAGALTLTSLIGKNTSGELWYPIKSISGTTVTLDMHPNNTGTAKGYSGTTGSAEIYRRETIKTAATSSQSGTIQQIPSNSGTSASPITISGGWDTTAMSSQTGDSYLDGLDGFGNITITGTTFRVDNIHFVRYNQLTTDSHATFDAVLGAVNLIGIQSGPAVSTSSSATGLTIDGLTINSCNGTGINPAAAMKIGPNGTIISNNSSAGMQPSVLVVGDPSATCTFNNNGNGAINGNSSAQVLLPGTFNAANNANFGVAAIFGIINNCTFTSNGTNAVQNPKGPLYLYNLTTSGHTVAINNNGVGSTVYTSNWSVGESSGSRESVTLYTAGPILNQDFQATAGSCSQLWDTGTITTVSSPLDGSSTQAWQLAPTSTAIKLYPLRFILPPVVCNASTSVTLTLRVQCSDTVILGVLRVFGGRISGISTDQTAAFSGSAGSYQTASITVTPTEAGAIQWCVEAYNSSTATITVCNAGAS